MALNGKRWQFRAKDNTEFPADYMQACGQSKLLAQLLWNRELQTPAAVRHFLNLEDYLPTSGLELEDMELGVERVMKAIQEQEPILIFGDFDVDGITGTSILYETLKYTLNAKVSYYIPDRATEGHGLNVAALCRLVSTRQIKVVITTDTGITNFNEVNLLKGLNVDTIITDHHELPENLPQAMAAINPRRLNQADHPFDSLSGAGVAFKFCELLLRRMKAPETAIEALLDLVAVGTVADLVPLKGENRYLVYRGLQVLNKRNRLGLNEIMAQAGVPADATLTSETIGFTIGPRLNALGRLDRADDAVELLTGHDPEQARVIASRLEHLNRRRQELCETTYQDAEKFLSSTGALEGRKAIILASSDWHLGIIGIVASRLIERYHRPTFMMVVDESKGEVRCSARSIPGFHLHDALVEMKDRFMHFGGHAGAGGFSFKLDQLESVKREIYAIADRLITPEMMTPIMTVDMMLDWNQLSPGLIEMVCQMEPFGQANPRPLFAVQDTVVAAQRQIGADGKHLKLILAPKDNPRQPLDGLIWNALSKAPLETQQKYHFIIEPELNTFNGNTKVQLAIKDYRPATHSIYINPTAYEGDSSGADQATASPSKLVIPSVTSVKPALVQTQTHTTVTKDSSQADQAPEPSGEASASDKSSQPFWIDHRNREGIDQFMQQLMLPAQQGRTIRLFHEGRPPSIPFLDHTLLHNRHQVQSSLDELILWDLPPDMETLTHILQVTQPSVVHWVGGKYQSVPLNPNPRDFLKVILQGIRREAQSGGDRTVALSMLDFAASLASNRTVVMNGLLLLNRLELLQVKTTDEVDRVTVSLPETPGQGVENIAQLLEYMAFQDAIRQVSRFRSWLMTSALDTIRESLRQPSENFVMSKREPVRQ